MITHIGSPHWKHQRLTAVALLTSFLLIFGYLLVSDLETISQLPTLFYLSIFTILCYHIALGAEVVIQDYVHDSRSQTFCLIVLRIAVLQVVQTIYVLTFFG